MKVVALISGGKDSCYSMIECIRYGHQVVVMANLMPPPSFATGIATLYSVRPRETRVGSTAHK